MADDSIKVIAIRMVLFDVAINTFLHGAACDNAECDEKGYCHHCVMRLEEAHEAAKGVESVKDGIEMLLSVEGTPRG